MCALIHQVQKAAAGNSELSVTTVISRPMWALWCEAVGLPVDSVPGPWKLHGCTRVFGSKTIVVERDDLVSWSYYNIL